MVNHGLSTGALFLLVGVIYERTHTRDLNRYGGLWNILPAYGGILIFCAMASVGLPGLNGFVGEFAILMGALGSSVLGFFFAMLGTLGVIMAAVYILYMFQKVFMGELDKPENQNLPQLN